MESNSVGRGNQIRNFNTQGGGKAKVTGNSKLPLEGIPVQQGQNLKPRGESVAVNLSPEARDLLDARNKAYQIAKETPDVREDKVAELKARIASGKYEINSENIADGMLREAVREKLSEIPD